MTEKECNRQFLKSSLTRQLYNCCNKDHYKAGVLISNSDKIKLIDIVVSNIISNNFSQRIIRYPNKNNRHDYSIEFDNGSIFKIVLDADNARGNRYHDILIDNDIDEETQFCLGNAKMIPYYIDPINTLETDGINIQNRLVVLNIE